MASHSNPPHPRLLWAELEHVFHCCSLRPLPLPLIHSRGYQGGPWAPNWAYRQGKSTASRPGGVRTLIQGRCHAETLMLKGPCPQEAKPEPKAGVRNALPMQQLSSTGGLCYPPLLPPFPMAIPFAYLPGSPGNCIAFHLGATPLLELSSHRPERLPLPCPGTALQNPQGIATCCLPRLEGTLP